MRTFLLLLILAVWILLGYKMCTDSARCCGADETTSGVTTETSKATSPAIGEVASSVCAAGPICFETNSTQATYGASFERYRDSLASLITEGKRLRITGLYSSSETYDGSFENLGFHRADAIGKRFGALVAANQIDLASQQQVGRDLGLADRLQIDVIDAPTTTAAIPQVESKTLIYFPFNSTQKLSSSEIEQYLRRVAERVTASGERISLVGHTDSKGQADANQALGLRRARVIRDYLVQQGVSRDNIQIRSQGESSPIATNETEEGRAQNRRTELTILN